MEGLDFGTITTANHDPVAHEVAHLIRKAVLRTDPKDLNPKAVRFQAKLRDFHLKYATPNGFVSNSTPVVMASRTVRSAIGIGNGIGISAWFNHDGSLVPVGGLVLRPRRVEIGALIAVWLTIPEITQNIKTNARNAGSSEIIIKSLNSLPVPDVDATGAQVALGDFWEAFQLYRASGVEAGSETRAPEFSWMRDAALAMWKR